MGKALSGELSCPCDRSCFKKQHPEVFKGIYMILHPFYPVFQLYQDDDSVDERPCAMEPSLLLERFLPSEGLEARTARSVGQA